MEKKISIKGDELWDAADLFDFHLQSLLDKMDKAGAVEGKVCLTVSVELHECMRPDPDTGEMVRCYVPQFGSKVKNTVMLSEEEKLRAKPNAVLRKRAGFGWVSREDNGEQLVMELMA